MREQLPLLMAGKVLLPGVEINMAVPAHAVALVEDCLRGAIPGNEIGGCQKLSSVDAFDAPFESCGCTGVGCSPRPRSPTLSPARVALNFQVYLYGGTRGGGRGLGREARGGGE